MNSYIFREQRLIKKKRSMWSADLNESNGRAKRQKKSSENKRKLEIEENSRDKKYKMCKIDELMSDNEEIIINRPCETKLNNGEINIDKKEILINKELDTTLKTEKLEIIINKKESEKEIMDVEEVSSDLLEIRRNTLESNIINKSLVRTPNSPLKEASLLYKSPNKQKKQASLTSFFKQ